jgi:hypothetical protein
MVGGNERRRQRVRKIGDMDLGLLAIGVISTMAGLAMFVFRRQIVGSNESVYSNLPLWLEKPYRKYQAGLHWFLAAFFIILGLACIALSAF